MTRQEKVSSICGECGAPLEFPLGSLQVQCGHCEAGLVVEKGQRLVRLSCPVCSGNFYCLDGSMGGRCPFCEAQLLALSRHRLLRFVIRPVAARPEGVEGAELIFLPFWHLSGLLLGWDVGRHVSREQDRDHQMEQGESLEESIPRSTRRDSGPLRAFRGRVVDLNLPDPAARAMGVTSLRLRAAVFPLEPFSQEHEALGQVMPPGMPLEEARNQLMDRAIHLGDPTRGMTQLDSQRLDLVCRELSLYYYPFWVQRQGHRDGTELYKLWDGVTGAREKLGPPVEAKGGEGGEAEEGAFDQLKVLELRCPKCGKGLTPGNHSMVLHCGNCGAFWEVTRDGLGEFEAAFARPPGGALPEEAVWLPFWRVAVRARYAGRLAHRTVDLRNVLGVMRPPFDHPKASPDSQLHYFVAAYGAMRAPRIDHAARDMTRTQPLLKRGPMGKGELYHCFFSARDAQALGYTTLIQILPGVVPHRIRSLRLETSRPQLWYVPFRRHTRELVNLITGLRYDLSAFRGVGH